MQTNHKANRQAVKRAAKQGKRYARQQAQRNDGPNTRIRVCKVSGSPFQGYHYVSLRTGKAVGNAQA